MIVTLAYLWLFRGTPVLFQIIFIYNVLPRFGIRLSAFVSRRARAVAERGRLHGGNPALGPAAR